jgi:hypothetical protein
MPASYLSLSTNLAYAKGAYTAAVEFGSERERANLALDTGSSTLVVLPRAYDPTRDRSLQPTAWAQQVKYGQGMWAGPVLHTEIGLGEGQRARRLSCVPFAVVQAAAQNFRDYDGLFGLAYQCLDRARDMRTVLTAQGVSPQLTWPWPFPVDDGSDLAAFRNTLRQQPAVTLTPLFTVAEDRGVLADKFAMLILRSLVHVLDDEATLRELANDPLNRGVLVLGGGEECQDLYEGPFRDVRIVHDLYYNANLVSVQVGSQPPIPVPPLDAADVERAASNAIFDTGSSFVILESSVYAAVRAGFARHDARFPALIDRFAQSFQHERGLPNSAIDHREWPDLHFHLEAPDGGEVRLSCTPGDYWQRNALHAGDSCFLLLDQLPGWPKQSILGLPVLAGYYCIFDRRAREPGGVLRIAKAQGT